MSNISFVFGGNLICQNLKQHHWSYWKHLKWLQGPFNHDLENLILSSLEIIIVQNILLLWIGLHKERETRKPLMYGTGSHKTLISLTSCTNYINKIWFRISVIFLFRISSALIVLSKPRIVALILKIISAITFGGPIKYFGGSIKYMLRICVYFYKWVLCNFYFCSYSDWNIIFNISVTMAV